MNTNAHTHGETPNTTVNVPVYTPLEVAVALSLYGYNVGPGNRAQNLLEHFQADCMSRPELMEILRHSAYIVTELPMPTAAVYVEHALARYGEEARERVRGSL